MQANQYGSAIIGDFPQQDRIPPPHQAGNIPVPRQGVGGHAATPEPLSLLNGGGSLLPPYQQQPQQQTLPHRQPFGSKNSSTGESCHFAPVLIAISPHGPDVALARAQAMPATVSGTTSAALAW